MFARNMHRSLLHSLRLRFDNLALVKQLREQKAIAEQANRAKSRFLAAASHDLRQPLHALGLFVDALRGAPDEVMRNRLLSQVDASLDVLGKLFNALLDISRLDAGVVEVSVQHFPLKRVLEKLEGEFRALAEQKGLAFRLHPCCVVVMSAPLQVQSVLNSGSSFCVGLPVGCAEAVVQLYRGGSTVDFQPTAERLVLVIDDEVDILNGMRDVCWSMRSRRLLGR